MNAGRTVKIASITDVHVCERFGGLVRMLDHRDDVIHKRDRMAQRPGLACAAMADCANERLGLGEQVAAGAQRPPGPAEGSRVRPRCLRRIV